MALRSNQLDRILSRLDNLDTANLTALVQRLAKERAFFELMLSSISEGVLIVSEKGVIVYANPGAMKLLGLTQEHIGSVRACQLLPQCPLRAESSTAQVSLAYPEERTLRIYITDLNGNETASIEGRWAIILSDQTEIMAEHASEMEAGKIESIMMLAGSVAHEIGNPLNSILIHLQMMARELRKLEAGKARSSLEDSISVCVGEIERLDSLLKNFLQALRPQTPHFVELRPLEPLFSVLALEKNLIEERAVRVDLELGDPLPTIWADPDQLKQVFYNVLGNALDALSAGGSIRIQASSTDEDVSISFTDSGCGIPEDQLPKIFEPFYTTKEKGNGLGLMIVQRIIADHGGSLRVESAPGLGTTVTLTLPLKSKKVRMLE